MVPDGFNPTRLVKKYSDKESGRKVGDPFSRQEREAIETVAAKYLNPEERARMKGRCQRFLLWRQ
jgi:hypothetical protein